MNTFNKLWGVVTPAEAQAKIDEQRAVLNGKTPENLEEQAIKLIGPDIYEKLIKGYTEKQWGRSATDLPPLSLNVYQFRLTFDITTSMTVTKVFQLGGITLSLKIC